MHLRLGYQDLKWKAWGGAVQFTSVGELLGCLPFPPRTFFASSHASAHWRTRLLSGILHAHGVCEKGCVCARVRAQRQVLGPLAVESNSLQVPSARGGTGSKFFPRYLEPRAHKRVSSLPCALGVPCRKGAGSAAGAPGSQVSAVSRTFAGGGVSQFTSCAGAGMSCCCAASARWGEFVVRSL